MAKRFSVKQLAAATGVTAKTLHLYDELGLLRPALRTDAGYRMYGEAELLRLQQVLFYRELDFPLKRIKQILDDPGFDLLLALAEHKRLLKLKRARISRLIRTLDHTIDALKNKTMLELNDLYDGLSETEAAGYRDQAVKSYGAEVVEHAEGYLRSLSKGELEVLVARQKELAGLLAGLKSVPVSADEVQELVHEHYLNTRRLWGTFDALDKQGETYKGLGGLYLTDERFTQQDGQSDPVFRSFIAQAMAYYVDHRL